MPTKQHGGIMFRIKTTTMEGKIFLSPFVYERHEAEKLVSNLSTWHHLPKFEIVPVNGYPSAAQLPEDKVMTDNDIQKAEYAWIGYGYRQKNKEALTDN